MNITKLSFHVPFFVWQLKFVVMFLLNDPRDADFQSDDGLKKTFHADQILIEQKEKDGISKYMNR